MTDPEPGSPNLARIAGAQLRALRRSRGLTLRDAAAICGVSYQMLGQIENGTNTTIGRVEQISRALEAVPSFVFLDERRPPLEGLRAVVADRFLQILPHIPDDELDVFVHEIALWERRYGSHDR